MVVLVGISFKGREIKSNILSRKWVSSKYVIVIFYTILQEKKIDFHLICKSNLVHLNF